MSTTPRINLVGFYNFDSTLFDLLTLPAGIDKSLFVDNVLLNYGERMVLYTNFDFYKNAIGVWGRKWEKSFDRINKALLAEYDPIHNYDRYEEYEDNETKDGNRKTDNTVSSTGTTDTNVANVDEVENKISAYNAEDYQPDNRSDRNTRNSTTVHDSNDLTGAETVKDNENIVRKHKAHLYGNIGVTTSTQMQTEVLNLYGEKNIYDIMASVFANEMLLFI